MSYCLRGCHLYADLSAHVLGADVFTAYERFIRALQAYQLHVQDCGACKGQEQQDEAQGTLAASRVAPNGSTTMRRKAWLA